MRAVLKKWVWSVLLIGGWMLIAPGEAWGQHFDDCIQNIDNATVVVPASVQASVGEASLEAGDEVALFTGDGTCAGSGIWEEERSLSIAAAGTGSQQPAGFEPDEPLTFRVWDASEEQVYEAEVSYTRCEEHDSICKDDGVYESERLFRLEMLDAFSVLPIELAAFEVTRDGEETLLQWQTASETNNAGFEVQHQGPHALEDEWTRLTFVEGQGTTSETKHYSHRVRDLSPGTHRFRLKQVDLDGAFEYSEAVEAGVKLAGAYDVVAPYPNPFRQQATFALTVAEEQRVDIVAYNQLGQRVATLHDGQLDSDAPHTFRFDGGRLSSGMYFIRIQGEQFTATERAILVR